MNMTVRRRWFGQRHWARRLATTTQWQAPTVTFSDERPVAKGGQQTTVKFVLQDEKWRDVAEAYLRGPVPGALGFSGKPNEIARLLHGDSQLLLVGLGDPKKDEDREALRRTLRSASFTAISTLSNLACKHVNVVLPDDVLPAAESDGVARAIVQACVLSTYRFDKYKTKSSGPDDNAGIDSIHIVGDQRLKSSVEQQNILARATCFSRDLGNERGDVATPEFMRDVCADLAQRHDFTLTVIEGSGQLEEERLHLLEAVGQGARVGPRLVMLEYQGDPSSDDVVALVGKGITFDTGGLNLKPTGSIEDMHLDKGGSTAVLGAMEAIGQLRPQLNIVACCAFAENSISADAFKPHAIIHSRSGRSVEVGNTDAEGRLVLADAMTYVQDTYAPHTMIDVATLTGACVVALGEYAAGVFSNDSELSSSIQEVGDDCFERCWPLPVLPEHTQELKDSSFADLRSIGTGREGGACTAAAFLQEFVQPGVQWAHIDVAGPAMYSRQREFMPKGATGFGACLLTRFLLELDQK